MRIVQEILVGATRGIVAAFGAGTRFNRQLKMLYNGGGKWVHVYVKRPIKPEELRDALEIAKDMRGQNDRHQNR